MEQVLNLKKLVKENENYRKAIMTGRHVQLVVMALEPGAEIPEEIHPATDQMFLIEDGKGEIVIDGKLLHLDEHAVAFVPAGAKHLVRNTGRKTLRLATFYAPPVHASDAVEVSAPRVAAKA